MTFSANTKTCTHCNGWGETDDCSKCLHCDGTGEVTIPDEDREIPFGPSHQDIPCTKCGKTAQEHHYERVDGGSLNAYWHTNCTHCGASDTNDIFS